MPFLKASVLLEHPETIEDWTEMEEATIRLAQFLKWMGLCGTGGEAKILIQEGEISVNGEVETRRGRVLRNGDRVLFEGVEHEVQLGSDEV